MDYICSLTFDDYVKKVISFHGFPAPGVIIGGVMVDLAYRNLPPEGFFDALCETYKCLPDAVQLLTPCTIGNGWLTIIERGKFALCLYEKYGGKGVRVTIDPFKLYKFPNIEKWFFKIGSKETMDVKETIYEIRRANHDIYKIEFVTVNLSLVQKKKKDQIAICPLCKEAFFPYRGDALCCGCKEETIFAQEKLGASKRR